MRKLSDDKKTFMDKDIKFTPYSVACDKLDIQFFEDEVEDSNPIIKKNMEESIKKYAPYKELQQDLFSALYKYKPKLNKETKIQSTHYLNYQVMKEIMESKKFEELRALTKLDKVNATIGTEMLSSEVNEILDELQEQQDLQENLNEDEAALAKASDPMSVKQAQMQLKETRRKLEASMKKKKVKNTLKNMLEKVKEHVTETSDMIENWGLGSDNTFTNMPYQEKLDLLKRLRNSDKLKRIARIAGRFKRIATQRQREKVKKGLDEIYDLTMGKDLSKLIPQESMKLRSPQTKLQFYRDWAEGKLLQYELRGKEKKQKGAIVCCVDNSGKNFT